MTTAVVSSAFLSADEIDALCAPLTQRHAQARKLCAMLGLNLAAVPRRPDGLPLIGRKMFEQRINGATPAAAGGFNWSKP